MTLTEPGTDPRQDPDRLPAEDDIDPIVGMPPGGSNPLLVSALVAMSALALFLFLNQRRIEHNRAKVEATAAAVVQSPPPQVDPTVERPVNPALFAAPVPAPAPLPQPAPIVVANPDPTEADLLQRRRAPAVVVDLQTAAPNPSTAAGQGGSANLPSNPALANIAAAAAPGANPNQTLLDRLAGASGAAPAAAVASQIGNLGAVITQGAMIPGVLETAINSDLPGYARAVVSRDVRSFDGRAVLIPRSSRLIGEYRSAISLGQSRVFVIWTRVIRPDGVSVDIASPGADALGRAGLQGQIDRHFFSRFGGSIVLSVLNAGVAAASRTPATQITIGSPAAALAAAGSATAGSSDIAPSIKIAQGEAINIFVARDLDFSAVKPVP